MKKISLMLFMLCSCEVRCASSCDEKQAVKRQQAFPVLQSLPDLVRPNQQCMPESRKLVLESAQITGGRLSIITSNIAIETLLTSAAGERGYALSQWKTKTGELGALAVCAQSAKNELLPLPILPHICKAFAILCSEKFKTAAGEEAPERLQKKISEAADGGKPIPLSLLFISGMLVQHGTIYILTGKDSFSAITLSDCRKVREQKTNYSIGCGLFGTSWDPC